MHAAQEAEKANFGYFGKWAVWRDRPLRTSRPRWTPERRGSLRFRSEGSAERKIKFTDLVKGQP